MRESKEAFPQKRQWRPECVGRDSPPGCGERRLKVRVLEKWTKWYFQGFSSRGSPISFCIHLRSYSTDRTRVSVLQVTKWMMLTDSLWVNISSWRQEEKGTTEDEMVGWHHRLNGREFEQAPGDEKDKETWLAAVPGVAKNRIRLKRLNNSKSFDTPRSYIFIVRCEFSLKSGIFENALLVPWSTLWMKKCKKFLLSPRRLIAGEA